MSVTSRSISLIISTRVMYESSDENIALMQSKVLSVFMTLIFLEVSLVS